MATLFGGSCVVYLVMAACTVDKALDPQPKVAAVLSRFDRAEHYTLGALITPPSVVYWAAGDESGNGCAQTTFPSEQNAYAVGAPLAPTAFVEMTIKTE